MNRTATPSTVERATIGRHALTPAPVRQRAPRRPRWVLLLALASCALLAACGGGAESRADIACNPDTLDCKAMYGALYLYRAVPDSAQGADIYTDSPALRAGYIIKGN